MCSLNTCALLGSLLWSCAWNDLSPDTPSLTVPGPVDRCWIPLPSVSCLLTCVYSFDFNCCIRISHLLRSQLPLLYSVFNNTLSHSHIHISYLLHFLYFFLSCLLKYKFQEERNTVCFIHSCLKCLGQCLAHHRHSVVELINKWIDG